MDIQVSIRHNLPKEGELFIASRVERFDGSRPLSAGSAEDCDCRIEDSESVAPQQFRLLPGKRAERAWHLEVVSETPPVFLNGQLAKSRQRVRSGDEIRIGHWTLGFHRVPSAGEYPYRRDIASVFNPALVLALLAIQAVLVLWLPRRIQASSLWETERLRQEVSYRVDVLRDELKNAGSDPDSVEQAAYDLLGRELRILAEFLHEHGRDLDQSQWRFVQNTLEQFRNARQQIDEDQLLRPLPPLDLDRAVRAAVTAPSPPEPEPEEGVEE